MFAFFSDLFFRFCRTPAIIRGERSGIWPNIPRLPWLQKLADEEGNRGERASFQAPTGYNWEM